MCGQGTMTNHDKWENDFLQLNLLSPLPTNLELFLFPIAYQSRLTQLEKAKTLTIPHTTMNYQTPKGK